MSRVYNFKIHVCFFHYVPCVHKCLNIQTHQCTWFCTCICIGWMHLRTNPTEPQGCKLAGSKIYCVCSQKQTLIICQNLHTHTKKKRQENCPRIFVKFGSGFWWGFFWILGDKCYARMKYIIFKSKFLASYSQIEHIHFQWKCL